jgi:hypothetical protein
MRQLLEAEQIKRFYGGWVEKPVHREWPHPRAQSLSKLIMPRALINYLKHRWLTLPYDNIGCDI